MARSYLRRRQPGIRARASQTSWTPDQLADLYGFPHVQGTVPTVAIGELGGGYSVADVTAYMKALNLPAPIITDLSVRGAVNSPGNDADGEVMLDLLVVAAVIAHCTGQPARILMAFAPNDANGIADATSAAAGHASQPVAMSWSWGAPEDEFGPLATTEAALQQAEAAGMAVTAAAGDNGSSDGENQGNHVDYPASSGYVIACGGTSIQASGGKITSEVVWNDGAAGGSTGGGYSAMVQKPGWQSGFVTGSGRGVPDLAANADPETGWLIAVDGRDEVIGGTSAVAPFVAALVALLSMGTGKRPGLLTPAFYGAATTFRDIVSGSNGSWSAGPGWDADTGLGAPIGTSLLAELQGGSSPTPPPPPPVPSGPTAAQAISAAESGLAGYARHFAPPFAHLIQGAEPSIAAALQQLWPASRSGRLAVNWAGLRAALEKLVAQFGPAAVPLIEQIVSQMPLNPIELDAVNSLIEALLGKQS